MLLVVTIIINIRVSMHGFLALLEEGFVLFPLAFQFLGGVRAACWPGPRVVVVVVLLLVLTHCYCTATSTATVQCTY